MQAIGMKSSVSNEKDRCQLLKTLNKLNFFSQYQQLSVLILKKSQMLKKRTGSKEKVKHWYDPFKSPPNYQKAKEHRKAWQVGIPKKGRKKRCQCCMYPLDKQFFDLRCTHTQLAPLGTSLAFYFEAIQIAVVVLLVQLLIALIGLTLNSGLPPLIFSSETLTKLVLSTSTMGYWYVLIWLLMMLVVLMVRKYSTRQLYNFQSQNYSQSSFTLQLSNLPVCQEYEIKKWILSQCNTQPLYIEIAYDIREWVEAFSKREELTILKNKLAQSQVDQDQSQDYDQSAGLIHLVSNSKADLEKVQAEIKKTDESFSKYRIHSSLTQEKQIGIAFVVFDSVKVVKDFFMKTKTKKEFRQSFKEKIVVVEKAPDPRDIIWEHLPYRNKSKNNVLHIIALFIGASLLILTCLFLRTVTKSQEILERNSLLYVIISVFYGLWHLGTHFLVQLYIKLTKSQTFTAEKLLAFRTYSFLNILMAALLPYFVHGHPKHLVKIINFTLFLDAFSHPLIKAFNLTNISKKLMGEYIKKLQSSKNVYTQDYLNRLLEGTKFRLGQNYHYILRSLLLASLYAYAAPLGMLYYSISIIIEAIVQKYLLCRICKTPPKHSSKLAKIFLDCLALVPICLMLGCLVYQIEAEQKQIESLWLNIICLALSLGFGWFYVVFLRSKTQEFEEDESYFSIKQKMFELYKWENPIKRYNGELFTKFATKERQNRPPALLDIQTPGRPAKSINRQMETVESARVKMMNRMSLANDLYDIHVNEDYKRIGDV